jgi:DNA polymerase (family X)
MQNAEIAKTLAEIADMLELTGENFFRVRAYRNAARTVQDHPGEFAWMSAGEMAEVPGIGKDLASKIQILAGDGEIPIYRELRAKVPPAMAELMNIPGLGPKRVKQLSDKLKVRSVADLKGAIESGALASIRGFGPKMEQTLRQAIERRTEGGPRRWQWTEAAIEVEAMLDHLAECRAAAKVEPAGSFRRRRETVGDIDLLATSSDPARVVEHFLKCPRIERVLGAGETKVTVVLKSGLQVDLRVVARDSYGAALVYFTGSKDHGVHIRKIAQRLKLTLNEYGLFRGKKSIAGETEEQVYAKLGLQWIPPELREDRGEVDAAARHAIPRLVERRDLRGDLHTHSTYTDGRASIAEMARAAKEAGLEYFAVTDHSRRLTMAHGLDGGRLRQQWREIEKVQSRLKGIRLLRGIEVDILEDGSLDLPDAILAELDWVVASVHYKLDQPRREMTRRLVAAMSNRNVDAIGHPSNRLIGRREPSSFDFDEVVRAARGEGCALEVNSQPDRLDLDDKACIAAKHAGVRLVISSDGHSTGGFGLLDYGVGQARRGWIEPGDVLNTRPFDKFPRRG